MVRERSSTSRHRAAYPLVRGRPYRVTPRPLTDAIFSTPTLIVLMIAAAIAIPIAVHNANDDAS